MTAVDTLEQIRSVLDQGSSRSRQLFAEKFLRTLYLISQERATCRAAQPLDYALLGLSETHSVENEIWESFAFQNLLPAFDDVPMRRVFPICFYTKESWTVGYDALVQAVVLTSGCELVVQYPFLEGSGVFRGLLRTSRRLTRKQFEYSQAQLAGQLAETLKKDKNVGNVTINFNFGTGAKEKETGEWSGRFKDFTEGIRNLILAGAAIVFVFDGTQVSSSQPAPPHQIAITQVERAVELQALPKMLDATNPQEFHEAIEPFKVEKAPQATAAVPTSGRKSRQ